MIAIASSRYFREAPRGVGPVGTSACLLGRERDRGHLGRWQPFGSTRLWCTAVYFPAFSLPNSLVYFSAFSAALVESRVLASASTSATTTQPLGQDSAGQAATGAAGAGSTGLMTDDQPRTPLNLVYFVEPIVARAPARIAGTHLGGSASPTPIAAENVTRRKEGQRCGPR